MVESMPWVIFVLMSGIFFCLVGILIIAIIWLKDHLYEKRRASMLRKYWMETTCQSLFQEGDDAHEDDHMH